MAKKKYTKQEREQLLDSFFANKVAKTDKRIEGELIRAYMFLIKAVAGKYARGDKISYYDDFIQLASIGFVKALANYRRGSEASFETYSVHCMTGEIRHYIRDNLAMIKIPPAYFSILNQINIIYLEFIREHDREPSFDDIFLLLADTGANAKINIQPDELKQLYDVYFVDSLNARISNNDDGDDAELIDMISEEGYKSFQLSLDDKIAIREALVVLDRNLPTIAQIVRFTFYYDLTQAEIAKKLGISQMEVSRSLKKGLNELWKILNKKII